MISESKGNNTARDNKDSSAPVHKKQKKRKRIHVEGKEETFALHCGSADMEVSVAKKEKKSKIVKELKGGNLLEESVDSSSVVTKKHKKRKRTSSENKLKAPSVDRNSNMSESFVAKRDKKGEMVRETKRDNLLQKAHEFSPPDTKKHKRKKRTDSGNNQDMGLAHMDSYEVSKPAIVEKEEEGSTSIEPKGGNQAFEQLELLTPVAKKCKKKSISVPEVQSNTNNPEITNSKETFQSTQIKKKKNVFKMEDTLAMSDVSTGQDKTEVATLDPVKEAARKKKQAKREKKKAEKLAAVEAAEAKSGTAKELARDYLKQWKDNRDGWKFQKVRQVWLLQNMFKSDQVGDEDFKILLEYLVPLKGKSRETTLADAMKIIDGTEEEENDADKETEVKTADRAKEVIQLLS